MSDLARAHVDGLDYLGKGWKSETFNCGYGQGYSVRQVIECFWQVLGREFKVIESVRRPGDPACVISQADRIRKVLGWTPQYAQLDCMVKTALAWEQQRAINNQIAT